MNGPVIIMQNGDVVTLSDGHVMLNNVSLDRVPIVIVRSGRRIYQLSSDNVWLWWRGKRGWVHVRSKKALLALNEFGV